VVIDLLYNLIDNLLMLNLLVSPSKNLRVLSKLISTSVFLVSNVFLFMMLQLSSKVGRSLGPLCQIHIFASLEERKINKNCTVEIYAFPYQPSQIMAANQLLIHLLHLLVQKFLITSQNCTAVHAVTTYTKNM